MLAVKRNLQIYIHTFSFHKLNLNITEKPYHTPTIFIKYPQTLNFQGKHG